MCVAIAEAHLDRVVRLERFGGGDRISGIVNDDRKATFHDPFKRIARAPQTGSSDLMRP